MKAFLKASFGVIIANDFIFGFVFYLIFMAPTDAIPPENDDFVLFTPLGVYELLLFLLAVSLVQMALALLLALPLFVMVRKYTNFSWRFGLAIGGFIGYLCYSLLFFLGERFELSLFLGYLGFGLFSGGVFAFFYSLFNSQTKHIQRR